MLLNVWLDDEPEKRRCPDGFIHVDNIDDIKTMLLAGEVDQLSLDHDLGVCHSCALKMSRGLMPDGAGCEHAPTGYDLVVWMADTNRWPRRMPIVHSRNPVGRQAMESIIGRHFRARE